MKKVNVSLDTGETFKVTPKHVGRMFAVTPVISPQRGKPRVGSEYVVTHITTGAKLGPPFFSVGAGVRIVQELERRFPVFRGVYAHKSFSTKQAKGIRRVLVKLWKKQTEEDDIPF